MSLENLEKDKPFDFQEAKNGLVRISYKGKTVVSLNGAEAARFLRKIENASQEQAQIVMAKATGHFKRGNEKLQKTLSNSE